MNVTGLIATIGTIIETFRTLKDKINPIIEETKDTKRELNRTEEKLDNIEQEISDREVMLTAIKKEVESDSEDITDDETNQSNHPSEDHISDLYL